MTKDKEKILAEAKKRFKVCDDVSAFIRTEALDDLNFIAGNQWPEAVRKERQDDARPTLTVDRLASACNQVINDQKQNRPQIKIRPVDDSADLKTAEVIEGIMRHIHYNSDAEAAYDMAIQNSVHCGMGYFRILTDYVSEDSFDQEIFIKRITNPFTIHVPMHLCKESDYSDMPYCFVTDSIPLDEFKAQYPKLEIGNWESLTSGEPHWFHDDKVRIAEYWVVEEKSDTLYSLSDGSTVIGKPEKLPRGVKIVKERPTTTRSIKMYKMTGADILDESDFPGRWIPIIPVLGPEMDIEGRKYLFSLHRRARDCQRMYNYYVSAEAEVVSMAPKAPFVIAEGQIEGYEVQWQTANKKNHAVLQYKPKAVDGQLVPPPQRQHQTEVPTAIVNAKREISEDIKAVTSIYNANLGAPGNETSGRAILARQHQGDVANFAFGDNLNRALRHAGRIIVDLIPLIYDTERAIRIIGDDKSEEVIWVNKQYMDNSGKPKLYDLSAGRYDVVIDTGPSYATKRIEASEAMLQFIQSYPAAAQAAGDLICTNLDFPGAGELAERLKKMVPPQLLDSSKGPTPQEMQQATQTIHGQQQLIQQLDGAIQSMQKKLDDKQAERQLKADTALLTAESNVEIAQIRFLGDQVAQMKDMLGNVIEQLQGIAGTPGSSSNTPTDAGSSAAPQPSANPEPAPSAGQ